MHHHTENESSLSSLFSLLSALVLSSSLSSPLLPLSLSLSVSVWCCVLCRGVVCGLCGVCGVVVWCETLKKTVCPLKHVPICTLKTSPCMPAQRAHVLKHVRVVPVHTGTFSTYIWGRVLSGHTGGGVFSSVKTSVFDICFASQPANFRVTNICPRISLDPRGSPKETIGSYPFFCSIIERSALARCNVLIIRSKKEHSSDYLFSDLRAIHTTPHPTPPPTAPHNKKTKTHTYTHM